MKHVLGSAAAAAVAVVAVSCVNAAAARAEPLTGEPWQIYAKTHNAKICQFIQRHPTDEGLRSAIKDITIESGMSPKDSGFALGMAVFGKCPQYFLLLTHSAPPYPFDPPPSPSPPPG